MALLWSSSLMTCQVIGMNGKKWDRRLCMERWEVIHDMSEVIDEIWEVIL
jgi:hypothetical protein